MIVTNSLWIIFRAVPAIIVIGIMTSFLVDIYAYFEVEEVERYTSDVYENLIGGPITIRQGIFDADYLELMHTEVTPYVRNDRFKYQIKIAHKCEDDNYCDDFCSAVYTETNNNKCETTPYEYNEIGTVHNVCKCFFSNKYGFRGLWRTSNIKPDDEPYSLKNFFKSESNYYNIAIKGAHSDKIFPATLVLIIYDTEKIIGG